jgi:hypothetical protein
LDKIISFFDKIDQLQGKKLKIFPYLPIGKNKLKNFFLTRQNWKLFIYGAKNSNFSFTRQKIQNFSLTGQKQKIFP